MPDRQSMMGLKSFVAGYLSYFNDAGLIGVLVELLRLESRHHQMYKHAFKMGMQEKAKLVVLIVNHLQCSICDIEPFRHRQKNQLAGFRAALRERGVVMPNAQTHRTDTAR